MDYTKWKVPELKAELTKRDLSVKGLKKDLVERLTKADEEQDVTMASIGAVEVRNELLTAETMNTTTHNKAKPIDTITHENGNEEVKLAAESMKTTTNGNGSQAADLPVTPVETTMNENEEPLPEPLAEQPVKQPPAGLEEMSEPTRQATVEEAVFEDAPMVQQSTREEQSTKTLDEPTLPSTTMQSSAPAPAPVPVPTSPTKRKRHITAEPPSERALPLAIHPPSSCLYISNLIRPLTILQVRSTLEKFGTVTRLWLDNIKSHAYVMFESIDEAIKAREALQGTKFPLETGREIHLEYIPSDRLNELIEHEEWSQRDGIKVELDVKGLEFRSNKASGRNFPPPMAPPSHNVKVLSLDELFSKTATKPSLYFKPVSEDEAAKRLLQL